MSGGVDSSVVAKLLSEQDFDLSAVYMRNWDTRDESGTDKGCEWEKDWEDVTRVCRMLDIPCEMVSNAMSLLMVERTDMEAHFRRSIYPVTTGIAFLSLLYISGNKGKHRILTSGAISQFYFILLTPSRSYYAAQGNQVRRID